MKILKLRFSNLNSLYGEWNIDFTDSSYQNDGIFAITGQTGSGKTTIMDAVCLALYGQTPRLGRISQGTNEIMSRKCGECFSEVLFESSKGRFLCHWSQKRSYLKPDGNLQSPRHEISDASTGNILESAKNMVLKAVEDATGMDFERFTRSVMLAQGGFAAFLEADPAERSPVLEQITGTEIYSRISVKVHEKTREEKDKLAILNAGINAVSLLSDGEIKVLSDEKEAKRIKSEELSEKIRNHDKCLLWLSKINELEEEISKLENENTAISKYSEEFSGELIRLEKAKRATELDGVYQNYMNVREQAEKSKADYDAAVTEIESLNSAISGLTEKSIQADEALNTLKNRFSEERETIEKVNSLDLRIEGEKKTFLDYKKRHDNLSEKIKKQEETLKILKESFAEKNQLLEIHENYLKYNNRDRELSENLGVIKEKFSILSDAEGKISKREKHLENIINDKKNCLSLLKKLSDALELRKDECRKTETEIKEKSGELLGVLNGREPQDIIKEREELEKVILGLERLAEISQRETDYISQKEAISERKISVETEKKAALLVLDGLEKNIEAEERILKELEEKRLLTAKIRSLEDERGKLTEGLPCPLCGSLTHPYSDKSIKPLLNAGDEYEDQQRKINSVKESLLETKRKTARLDAESELNDKRILDIEKDLLKTGLEIKSELFKIGLNADETDEKKEPEYYSKTIEELKKNLDSLKEIIEKAEFLRKSLENAQQKNSSSKDSFYNSEKDYTAAKNRFEGLVKEESIISADISGYQKAFSSEITVLITLLSKFVDIKNLDDNEILKNNLQIQNSLEERKEKFRMNTSEKEKLSKETDIIERETDALKISLSETKTEISEVSDKLNKSESSLLHFKNERYTLYQDKNPKEEEKKLSDLIFNAQSKADEIKEKKHSQEGSLKSKIRQKESLETEKTRYSSTLMAKEMVFSEAISDAGFSGEHEFLKALLPPEEIKRLESKRDEISDRKKHVDTMLSERNTHLKLEIEKNLTGLGTDEILADKLRAESENKNILSEIGGIEAKISENETKTKDLAEKLKETESQKKIYKKWERLHELIGSSDGKKFRNFAQGLTFEIMIANANRQLESMNDRYLLVQNPEKPLDLCVIDNYQAGEVRSTKNLSGGESFIISLALALGLSNMAGRNVRVDSLFLDEGFGTLDEDSLETAIETLAGLKQDGKLIGVISHVAAIKERIPTKIEIMKKSGGRSTLKGPGCSHKRA